MTRLHLIILAGSIFGVLDGLIIGRVAEAAELTGDWRLTLGALILVAQAVALWCVLARLASLPRFGAAE